MPAPPPTPARAGGIDFFDVDHTLTRRSSGSRFVATAMRQSLLPRRLLFLVPWYSLTYRLGVFRPDLYAQGFPALRGLSRDTLLRIARESFEGSLKDDLFPQAVELVRSLRADGRRVALATSSLDLIVAPLADFLGIREVLATELEFVDGTCTGRFLGRPMFRREKRQRVLAFLEAEGVQAGQCSFYSDSIYDLSLLESVGHPVAVNPDFRLRRIARSRGWRIQMMRPAPRRRT
jgi:HAD superfamily hydrolase (TIGR01490 family)